MAAIHWPVAHGGSILEESSWRTLSPKPEDIANTLKRDDWNDYTIRCEGRRIQLWINGLQTVDYTETDEALEQTGLIDFQIHGGGPSEAWYKKIRIKELK